VTREPSNVDDWLVPASPVRAPTQIPPLQPDAATLAPTIGADAITTAIRLDCPARDFVYQEPVGSSVPATQERQADSMDSATPRPHTSLHGGFKAKIVY
jgi:hypothetical protein